MAKKKEQLEDVVEETPEEIVEETKEESTEEVVEAPKEASVEVPAEVKEDEAIEKVEELEVEPEKLYKEILETKEELSVITEVRNELVKLYADFQDSEKLKDISITENEVLKEQLNTLSAKLQGYQVAEEQLAAEKQLQRLERLSAKFTALGQSKSVEQLGLKDTDTLSEFERIVDAALGKVGETAEMPSVTTSSQTEVLSTKKTEQLSDVAPEKPVEVKKETLSNKDFFSGICNTLQTEQVGLGAKKVIDL